MRLVFFLTLLSLNSFGQRTFVIDKGETDSIQFKDYKIFLASDNVVIDFLEREISKSNRFELTRDEAIKADKEFRQQYVDANLSQYYKQLSHTKEPLDSTAIENLKRANKRLIRKIERNALQYQRKRIDKYDRYFFGYSNADNDKLILMRFDPQKIRYYSISSESFIDVLTIYVLNLDKNILSMAGWSDFKE
jgi:hypothetical protein